MLIYLTNFGVQGYRQPSALLRSLEKQVLGPDRLVLGAQRTKRQVISIV